MQDYGSADARNLREAPPEAIGHQIDPLLEFSLTWPDRLVEPDAWVGHIPFAFWIIAAHRPRTLVELGTHSGNSYCAFCQAVARLHLETACYAVDTWQGDPQAGFYGEEVFDEFSRYHNARYSAFSRLVRSTFDEAAEHFADGSIDLLHIDGCHTYEAVKHDLETWLPKLSRRGVVLFHDVNVRERDFGAWRLWQEISADHPSFAFHHSHGLGVLGVGDEQSDPVRAVLTSSDDSATALRRWFGSAAHALQGEMAMARVRPVLAERDGLAAALHEATRQRSECEAEWRRISEEREREWVAVRARLEVQLAERERDWGEVRARLEAQLSGAVDRSSQDRELMLAEIQQLRADRAVLLDARTFLQRKLEKEGRRRRRLTGSISWRATRPLRAVASAIDRLSGAKRRVRPPQPSPDAEPSPLPSPPDPAETPQRPQIADQATYVPLVENHPLQNPVARVVAFYLPQFHPIPENDKWWGKGFTEWTNVSKAAPLFEGHYQPHLPGELGFYDLRLVEVQQRQVELAKIYGISAFCFYFYWFNGRQLLQRPLEQWLDHPELDLEFCLCWANENWTRRWDGLESEVLIGQHHSPEDDLAFITKAARYLRDPRYVRIDGKPLLLVYRPALLPDAQATTLRWRDWCRENGIGEIVLGYTQSFERDAPATYGFDLAVEFPPNKMGPTDITEQLKPWEKGSFAGSIYDWRAMVERSRDYPKSEYPLLRGVNPSWDNSARRAAMAAILHGSEPRLFRDWVQRATQDTLGRFFDSDSRLVFVNAWNEWAEGAHLEPDRRYGYAHLEAVRQGLRLAAGREVGQLPANCPVAVIIHAFYPEILDEIFPRLLEVGLDKSLFITCVEACRAEVEVAIARHRVTEPSLVVVPNRGRDVAPFLRVAGDLDPLRFPLLLKLHTKRSRHRSDGDRWRQMLYTSLLDPKCVETALAALRAPSGYGIIGPDKGVVAMTYYQGSNIERVRLLAEQMGVASLDERHDGFVAGTMFFARTAALAPLLALGLRDEDFELESGQVDGTLAHSIERSLTYAALAAGYRIGELQRMDGAVVCIDPDVSAPNFHFAENTHQT